MWDLKIPRLRPAALSSAIVADQSFGMGAPLVGLPPLRRMLQIVPIEWKLPTFMEGIRRLTPAGAGFDF